MGLGIGIDAGGTYTDAVVYDFEEGRALAMAKALTTKEDLSVGILGALDALPRQYLEAAGCVALSTTLATNACVEDKGGRGKLLFIGVDSRVVEWVGDSYGLPPLSELRIIPRPPVGDKLPDEDWERFAAENGDWLREADGIAVVDIDAAGSSAGLEKDVRERIAAGFGVPVICGYELSGELNSIRRGASTLLNVRLIPVIGEFLTAIRGALRSRGVEAPVTIVRSDGTLMSERFTGVRPVETLLCGPAAGLIGGAHLTGERDCLVIDMGGTTTDIYLVRGGIPQKAQDGINIGKWRTFVKGAFVDTFGLGGDSAVRIDRDRNLVLMTRRVMPLCMAAERWPAVREALRELVAGVEGHTFPLQEFFFAVKDADERYSRREREFVRALGDGPVIFTRAAKLWGTDVYNFNVDRLEREGVIMRCGLTPTDIMHLRGDFTGYDTEAAELGARFVAAGARLEPEVLADRVYEAVKKTLYKNIARILLQDEYPALRGKPLGPDLTLLVEKSWEAARKGKDDGFLRLRFETPAALVGIGAPTHIFLPDVAKALVTRWAVPENAGVANALGAVVSRVETVAKVEVRPDGEAGFRVLGPYETQDTEDRDEAVRLALIQAERSAREEAQRRGITGELSTETGVSHDESLTAYGSEIYLGSLCTATVRGSAYAG